MWIIGYNLALIFGNSIRFLILTPLIFILSLLETQIMKSDKSSLSLEFHKKSQGMIFENNEIKINYAKAKLIFSIGLGIIFYILNSLFNIAINQADPNISYSK